LVSGETMIIRDSRIACQAGYSRSRKRAPRNGLFA
jgi:hypothetical protein